MYFWYGFLNFWIEIDELKCWDQKTDGEFQIYENEFRISKFSGSWTNRQIREPIRIDELKCWDQKTDGEFRIYERISAEFFRKFCEIP